jgi:hypothetical protein
MPRISFTGKETMVMQGRCVGVDRVGGEGGWRIGCVSAV